MTNSEWESLCDGCGRCCLNKFEDSNDRVFFTDVACKLLNSKTCACKDYPNRKKKVPDCVQLTPKIMPKMNCLPKTCAYRLLDEGKELPWWHHLRTGSRKTVHDVGISVKDRVVSEVGLSDEEIERRIVTWPSRANIRKDRS